MTGGSGPTVMTRAMHCQQSDSVVRFASHPMTHHVECVAILEPVKKDDRPTSSGDVHAPVVMHRWRRETARHGVEALTGPGARGGGRAG